MKCNLFGTVVGKRVIKSRDGKEYPCIDVYSDGELSRVFGLSIDEYQAASEGEVIEWPVRVYVNDGKLSVRLSKS